ncbi:MAG: GTP-binding protein [Phycisphaerales bacterium]|jgi:small GTP-binding protein|nr:GTP-binding protein [Phycisphaerales bacterium]
MSDDAPAVKAWWATTPLSGAIGILHLEGDCPPILQKLTGTVPAPGSTALASLASVDRGLVARPTESSALLMPHGGPQIRRRLSEAVLDAGAVFIDPSHLDPRKAWPEARNLVEACMLESLTRTSSPLGIDLLMKQPRLHAIARSEGWRPDDFDRTRASTLSALIDPPLVAIVGAPNVGKSSLLNRLAGREVAITADLAGTTRDAVTSRVVLDGLACDLVDLPGERTSDDPIEQHAIRLARGFLREASLLIGVVEPDHPEPPALERAPDLLVTNKTDLGSPSTEIGVSARTGQGIPEFVRTLRHRLVPEEALLGSGRPWLFDPALDADEVD